MPEQWFTFREWSLASINFYRVPTEWPPVPTVMALLFAAWLLLAVLRVSGRLERRRFWAAAGTAGLAAWLLLDALWQLQLGRQVASTWSKYAGLPLEDRLLLSDGEYYRLGRDFSAEIAPGSRVFVSSDSDFGGMRIAFHLYPHNVYWKRHDPVPPVTRPAMVPGDYIAIMRPSSAQFFRNERQLRFQGRPPIPVTPVVYDSLGGLFRVR